MVLLAQWFWFLSSVGPQATALKAASTFWALQWATQSPKKAGSKTRNERTGAKNTTTPQTLPNLNSLQFWGRRTWSVIGELLQWGKSASPASIENEDLTLEKKWGRTPLMQSRSSTELASRGEWDVFYTSARIGTKYPPHGKLIHCQATRSVCLTASVLASTACLRLRLTDLNSCIYAARLQCRILSLKSLVENLLRGRWRWRFFGAQLGDLRYCAGQRDALSSEAFPAGQPILSVNWWTFVIVLTVIHSSSSLQWMLVGSPTLSFHVPYGKVGWPERARTNRPDGWNNHTVGWWSDTLHSRWTQSFHFVQRVHLLFQVHPCFKASRQLQIDFVTTKNRNMQQFGPIETQKNHLNGHSTWMLCWWIHGLRAESKNTMDVWIIIYRHTFRTHCHGMTYIPNWGRPIVFSWFLLEISFGRRNFT